MLVLRDLGKRYGGKSALRGLNLNVEPGQLCVILGPNGAGKSTLLRLICTLSRPSSGDAVVGGHSVLDDPVEVRKLAGVALHETLLYEDLTAAENLEFYSRLLGVSSEKSVIDEMLSRVELLHRRNDMVGTFSRGMKQRLSIARAMLGSPKVLLLDEPFSGLDIKARGQVSSMLTQAIADGATILLTAHDPELGYDLGHRLLVLVDGTLVYDREKSAVSKGEFVEEYRKLVGAIK
jgi:ABC-type multidrug transport system ATPase subunit